MNKLREGVLRVFVCAYVFSTHIYLCVTCFSVYLLVTRVTFMTEGTRVWWVRREKRVFKSLKRIYCTYF